MYMVGVILFVAIIAVIFVMVIVAQEKKGGIVTDLKDFEYDSKKEMFRKKVVVDDDQFEHSSSTNPLNTTDLSIFDDD